MLQERSLSQGTGPHLDGAVTLVSVYSAAPRAAASNPTRRPALCSALIGRGPARGRLKRVLATGPVAVSTAPRPGSPPRVGTTAEAIAFRRSESPLQRS